MTASEQRGTTHDTTASADGTTIALSRAGAGPPVVLVDGALCHRGVGPNRKLAARLAEDLTVVTYDRRGRGESGDTAPYAIEREVEDLEAVVATVGGSAHLYGISSGGALALQAACQLPGMVAGLAVYEIPFVVDGSRRPARPDLRGELARLVGDGRRGEAVKLFMRDAVGLPSFLVRAMPFFPGWSANKALAHTLPYDVAIMGDGQQGRALPPDRWESLAVPTLVANGAKSPAWVRAAAAELATVLDGAEHTSLPGQRHYVKPAAIAPVLTQFFTTTTTAQEDNR